MITCAKCGVELYQDEKNTWKTVAAHRASCRKGGPHQVVVDVEVNWETFESVLDQWTNDAL